MTTKLEKLDVNPNRLFHRSIEYLKSIAIFLLIWPSQQSVAQNIPAIETELPPPPRVNQNKQAQESIPITIDGKPDDRKREYKFQTNSSFSYRVEVYGDSPRLLNKVKRIVPNAFRKSGTIQAGIFQDPENAEDLILQLTSQGFWARIVTVDR